MSAVSCRRACWLRTTSWLWGRCDEELQRQTGLALGRLEVLHVIASVDPCRVNQVSARLLIIVGAASKLVDRLEAACLCQRHPNPQDRRSSLLLHLPMLNAHAHVR